MFTYLMTPHINSINNAQIKSWMLLQKSTHRKSTGLFIAEGHREIYLAHKGGYFIQHLLVCEELFLQNELQYPISLINFKNQLITVSPSVFNKIAYRENQTGLLAIVQQKKISLQEWKWNQPPLFLVLENIEKPGNIGALLRTADAAGVSGVLCCHCPTDLYNPNIIRSSLGCLFSMQIVSCTNEDAYHFLMEHKSQIYSGDLTAQQNYDEVDFAKASAIILGAEAHGVSVFWQQENISKIKIPMQGTIDSMNVSAAGAVLIFEAIRQRRNSL